MRTVDIELRYENGESWGTFWTTIGNIVVEGYVETNNGMVEISMISVGSRHLPSYLVPTKLHNYLYDLITEEL